jgi:hypothetical protein
MPNLKKVIIFSLVGLPLLGFALYKLAIIGVSYWLGTSMCSSTIYKTIKSPDGHYSAILLEEDCGATTSWSTQVFLESNQLWQPGKERILSLRGRPAETQISITWVKNRELKITTRPTVNPYIRKSQWRNAQIHYDSTH